MNWYGRDMVEGGVVDIFIYNMLYYTLQSVLIWILSTQQYRGFVLVVSIYLIIPTLTSFDPNFPPHIDLLRKPSFVWRIADSSKIGDVIPITDEKFWNNDAQSLKNGSLRVIQRNWVFVTNSDFLSPISL